MKKISIVALSIITLIAVSCSEEPEPIKGCMCETASNYNPDAQVDDGSCTGCTDSGADNFIACAIVDDGSCYTTVLGCTDPQAANYNPNANTTNGTCYFNATVQTNPTTFIKSNSFGASGRVDNDGNSEVTERGFLYGTNQEPSISNSQKSIFSISGTGGFITTISELQPNTKYYYRAYAINEAGMALGNIVTFTTTKSFIITAKTPSYDAVDQEVNTDMTFTFSNNVDASTINTSNLSLSGTFESDVPLTFTVAGNKVTIKTGRNLIEYTSRYNLYISPDVKDVHGNNLVGAGYQIRFQTRALSSLYYYRITNRQTGWRDAYSMDTPGGSYDVRMMATGPYSGQSWSADYTGSGYLLYNSYRGRDYLLTINNNNQPAYLLKRASPTGGTYGNQYWKFRLLSNQSFSMEIQSSYFGTGYQVENYQATLLLKADRQTTAAHFRFERIGNR